MSRNKRRGRPQKMKETAYINILPQFTNDNVRAEIIAHSKGHAKAEYMIKQI